MQKSFYRQRLPHIQSPNAVYFVTYRLYGSIPVNIIEQSYLEKEHALQQLIKSNQFSPSDEYNLQKKYFAAFDSFLDTNPNDPYWLQIPQIAQCVYDSLLYLQTTEIDLYCFTIMSNHVHAVFSLKGDNKDLYKVMQSHKSFTAKKGNEILQREGAFWEPESYDHILRNGEYGNIVNYILQNAVKAGLVKKWEDWKWSYLAE